MFLLNGLNPYSGSAYQSINKYFHLQWAQHRWSKWGLEGTKSQAMRSKWRDWGERWPRINGSQLVIKQSIGQQHCPHCLNWGQEGGLILGKSVGFMEEDQLSTPKEWVSLVVRVVE